jgi:hypothetical protein
LAKNEPKWSKLAKISKNGQLAGSVAHEQMDLSPQFNLADLLA